MAPAQSLGLQREPARVTNRHSPTWTGWAAVPRAECHRYRARWQDRLRAGDGRTAGTLTPVWARTNIVGRPVTVGPDPVEMVIVR